ncbi:autotransporter outer membrane beta-barrel domain-containing protein [Pandoraea pnomenusa]|uniref:autotransporter outer membrane beta-barrel domain-containing protein n=1 Tax=Pandoraea pnomenusa TaxID=93220 RepID=UPI0011986BB4|nr:autotransporter outer membrane beta-barrel domain-containing protein [Pandoraea pnomenusa]QDX20617.1 autotransporter outer membrane beta-barrel domain-containing protein [Pandoraea pnomenusa]
MRTTSLRQVAAPHSPRHIARGVALLLACLVAPAQAALVDNDLAIVDAPGDPDERWTVRRGGQLILNPGVATNAVSIQSHSQLVADGATIVSTSDSSAVQLMQAQATISNSVLSSALGTGLSMGRDSISTGPSSATVSDSTIHGYAFGVNMNGGAQLALHNTHVTAGSGLAAGFNAGVVNFGGDLVVTGGSLTGANGLWVSTSQADTEPRMSAVLDGTNVVGTDGAGIRIQRQPTGPSIGQPEDALATVVIANGTTVTGSNGNLIEGFGDLDSNITVDNSQLTGNVVGSDEANMQLTLQNHASITGSLINVDSLSVDSNAKWSLSGDNHVAKVAMDNGGTIDIHGTASQGAWHTLNVDELSGNGTFGMQADLAIGESDRLNVTDATGAHKLHVSSSGKEGGVDTQLLVEQAGGDATFSLVGDKVDAGVYTYSLKQGGEAGGEQSWYLERNEEISSGADTVLGIHNALPTVWLGEHSALRSRLGEVRMGGGESGGAWARTFGSRFNASPSMGRGYAQDQWGVIAGGDAVVMRGDHGHWLVGGMLGTSTSRLDFNSGSRGTIESHTAGAYATWLGKNGYYFDGVLKYNRFGNELDVRMSDGVQSKANFVSHGVGLSAELGRTIEWQNRWFVEPFAQVAGMWASGTDFTLDNGMHARSNRTMSLLGTVGVNVGKTFETSKGTFQPYVKLAVTHEFAGANSVTINDIALDNDISGTRFEVGAGLAAQMTKRLQAYADGSYSIGKRLDKPWGVNVGVRYTF